MNKSNLWYLVAIIGIFISIQGIFFIFFYDFYKFYLLYVTRFISIFNN
jgi:hypothetical protein